MFKFVFGVLVGAAGFWAYRFWKGGDDLSWDQPYSPSGVGANSYGSYASEPVGSGTPATPSSGGTSGTTGTTGS
jgi:hypothetical protein